MFKDYFQKLRAEGKKVWGYIWSMGGKRFFSTTAAMLITLALLVGFWNHFILPKQQALKPHITAEQPRDSIGEDETDADVMADRESDIVRPADAEPQEEKQQKHVLPENPDIHIMKKPLEGQILRTFGFNYSSTFDDFRHHAGIDIEASKGTPVMSALGGIVESANLTQEEAYKVVIDHGGGWRTVYSHLGTVEFGKGEWVEAGAIIGVVGTPGRNEAAIGHHLHFEIIAKDMPVDPQEYLDY